MLKLSLKERFYLAVIVGICLLAALLNGAVRPWLTESVIITLDMYALVILCLSMIVVSCLNSIKKIIQVVMTRSRIVSVEDEAISVLGCISNTPHIERNAADYVSKLIRTIREAEEGRVSLFSDFADALSYILFVGIYYGLSSPWLLLTSVIFAIMCVFAATGRNTASKAQEYMMSKNALDEYTWSLLLNKESAAYLRLNALFSSYLIRAEKAAGALLNMNKSMAYSIVLNQFGSLILTFAVIIVGGLLCMNGFFALTRLLSMIIVLPFFLDALLKIPQLFNRYKQVRGYEAVINSSIFDLPRAGGSDAFPTEYDEITLKNVTVCYDENVVLKDMSVSLKRGEVTVIRGAVGAGKSTILRMIAGTQVPDEGEIYYGSVAAREIRRESLWKNVSIVAQELADTANSTLSSGETQKAALERALGKNAAILLLDEPTSAMDKILESESLELISSYAKDKYASVVLVMHRECAIGDNVITIKG